MKSETIKEALDFDQAQHRGLMSALAVRVNNTPRELFQHHKPGLDLLLHCDWLGDQMAYRARPELVEALRRLPELDALVRSDVATVVHSDDVYVDLPDDVEADPPVSPPGDDEALPEAPATPFAQILDALFHDGLHYPSELVANFVLALQTKRFAILTGISGTGKTRIAQALAARYARPSRRVRPVEVDDPRAVVLTVKPYMRKYTRFIVPKDLVMQWPSLDALEGGGEHVTVRWPGGEHDCSVYGGVNATSLLLTGPARIWFTEALELGAPFVVRLEGPEDEPEALFIEPVEQEIVEDPRPENYEVVAVRPDWTDSRGAPRLLQPDHRAVRHDALPALAVAGGSRAAARRRGGAGA